MFKTNSIQSGYIDLVNGNTSFGQLSLARNTSGSANTAFGFAALDSNTTGGTNTAIGNLTMIYNKTGVGNTAVGNGALLSNTASGNTAVGIASLASNTTGIKNVAVGSGASEENTTGVSNSAYGYSALQNNVTGSFNTAIGTSALEDNTVNGNTAVGNLSLSNNTTGTANVGVGNGSLTTNVSGRSNTAVGSRSLFNNVSGFSNTAIGANSLENSTQEKNTAVGDSALYATTLGYGNTATGSGALQKTTDGNSNVANGWGALYNNTQGYDNTAIGVASMFSNTTGGDNTAIGDASLYSLTTGNFNVANGYDALLTTTTGTGNTAIGSFANVANGSTQYALSLGYAASAVSKQLAISDSIHTIKAAGLPTGAGYVLTDVSGNGNLSMQPPVTGDTTVNLGNSDLTQTDVVRNFDIGSPTNTLDIHNGAIHLDDGTGDGLTILPAAGSVGLRYSFINGFTADAVSANIEGSTVKIGGNPYDVTALTPRGDGYVITDSLASGIDYLVFHAPATGGGLDSVPTANVLYVAKNGNDGTGVRNDIAHPYLTINAAVTAAASKDVIVVYPGDYTETSAISLAKSNNFEFIGKGNLWNVGSGTKIFDEGNVGIRSVIHASGWTFSDRLHNQSILYLLHASTVVITVDSASSSSNTYGVQNDTANLTINGNIISSSFDGTIYLQGGTITVTANEVYSTSAASAGRCLYADHGSMYAYVKRIFANKVGSGAIKTDNLLTTDHFYVEAEKITSGTGSGWTIWFDGASLDIHVKAQYVEGWGSCQCVSSGSCRVIAQIDEIHNKRIGGTGNRPRGLYNAEVSSIMYAIGTKLTTDTTAGTTLYTTGSGQLFLIAVESDRTRMQINGGPIRRVDNYFPSNLQVSDVTTNDTLSYLMAWDVTDSTVKKRSVSSIAFNPATCHDTARFKNIQGCGDSLVLSSVDGVWIHSVPITHSGLLALSGSYGENVWYQITDAANTYCPTSKIYVKAISSTQLDLANCVRTMNVPFSYAAGADDGTGDKMNGIWNSTTTPAFQLVIWGGRVWKSVAGLTGSAIDDITLNADWTLQDQSTFPNDYIDLQFGCSYDLVNDWVAKQWDDKGNVFGVDYAYAQANSLAFNPVDITDWNLETGGGTFINNSGIGIWNKQYPSVINTLNVPDSINIITPKININHLHAPIPVFQLDTTLGADIATTDIPGTNVDGLYRVQFYLSTNTSDLSSGLQLVQFSYNNILNSYNIFEIRDNLTNDGYDNLLTQTDNIGPGIGSVIFLKHYSTGGTKYLQFNSMQQTGYASATYDLHIYIEKLN